MFIPTSFTCTAYTVVFYHKLVVYFRPPYVLKKVQTTQPGLQSVNTLPSPSTEYTPPACLRVCRLVMYTHIPRSTVTRLCSACYQCGPHPRQRVKTIGVKGREGGRGRGRGSPGGGEALRHPPYPRQRELGFTWIPRGPNQGVGTARDANGHCAILGDPPHRGPLPPPNRRAEREGRA